MTRRRRRISFIVVDNLSMSICIVSSCLDIVQLYIVVFMF